MDLTLTVRVPHRIRIESETPVTISIEPLTSDSDDAAVLPFPPRGSSSTDPDDYEPNPR